MLKSTRKEDPALYPTLQISCKLVLSATRGMGNEATTFFKLLASLLAKKWDFLDTLLAERQAPSSVPPSKLSGEHGHLGVIQLYLTSLPSTSLLLNLAFKVTIKRTPIPVQFCLQDLCDLLCTLNWISLLWFIFVHKAYTAEKNKHMAWAESIGMTNIIHYLQHSWALASSLKHI